MPLVPYVPDPRRYDDVFVTQLGGGGVLVRYRGSPYQNGSCFFPQILKNLFSKIGSFIRPLANKAIPHARAAMDAAMPHLKEAASGAIKDATTQATQAIARRLVPQEGTGKRTRKAITKKKNLKAYRIAPYNIPDTF